ncbi:hypothetical protein EVAR_65802_1 [Eumeta japonica]|uniref:Uncharacterized protein n=1 Tax=Eumeta variegata TaxID=151549 RepID=A0A4C1ZUF1_EUMVA|nr:hypothetical protein EVAR_65802_1 [Eumeta japonica]
MYQERRNGTEVVPHGRTSARDVSLSSRVRISVRSLSTAASRAVSLPSSVLGAVLACCLALISLVRASVVAACLAALNDYRHRSAALAPRGPPTSVSSSL